MRETLWSSRSRLIRPLSTASVTAPTARSRSGGIEEHVDAGLDRPDGHLVVAVLLPHALHRQRVGDDDAVVAEALTQQAGDDRLGERGGVARRVERGDDDVGGHDRVDALVDGRGERRLVDRLPLLAGVVDHGDAGVAVDRGVAVAREVLGRGGDASGPRLLVAAHLRAHHVAHQAGVGREAADADHRVLRVDVHVGVGRVVGVDADRPQLAAGDVGSDPGVAGAAAGAEGHAPRQLSGRRADPDDHAHLLVGAHQQRRVDERAVTVGGRALQPVGEPRDLGRCLHVVRPGEVDDTAQPVPVHDLGRGPHPVQREVLGGVGVGDGGRVRAVRVGDEQLPDLLRLRHLGEGRADVPVGSPCAAPSAEAGGTRERASAATTPSTSVPLSRWCRRRPVRSGRVLRVPAGRSSTAGGCGAATAPPGGSCFRDSGRD